MTDEPSWDSPGLLEARGKAQERLHARAATAATARFGRQVFLRAVVEVSNHCRENCSYCGMRRDNRALARFRAHHDQLAELLIHHRPASVTDVNIQAGEDPVVVREVVLPLIRTLLSFNAYSEGWALYAEQLGDELGLYKGFEVGRLGYLNSIAFRASRLVVDTGLHHKRWTREQARQFFLESVGDPNASEVDRYCSWPGQACGYEMGHQAINRERDKAKAALGPRFDLKAFNDAVVLGGNVPMDVLAKNVDAYIASARA